MDDNTVENNETFILIINPESLSNKIYPANPDRATVTIVDNDG